MLNGVDTWRCCWVLTKVVGWMVCRSCGRMSVERTWEGELCDRCARARVIEPRGLSRRTLLARAGALGATALAFPALACGLSGVGERNLVPAATPPVGTVTSGRYRIQWQKTAQTHSGVSASDLAAMAEGYGKALDTAYATEQQFLQQDLQTLGQVSDIYGKRFTAALGTVGVDVAQLQADLEALGKLTDPQAVAAAEKTLDAKYLSVYPKAYALAGMDRDAIVDKMAQQIRPRVSDPTRIVPASTGSQLGWGWTGLLDEGSSSASPCPELTFVPPYELSIVTLGLQTWGPPTPTPSTEAIVNSALVGASDYLNGIGSRQEVDVRAVGVWVDPTATHLHVEADIRLDYSVTRANAFLGYASAEAILHLQLLNDEPALWGATVLAENRLSLARSVAVVCTWDDKSSYEERRFTLSLDYPLPAGNPSHTRFYVGVQAETWVGCGAGMALAGLRCFVERCRISTTC